MDGPTKWWPALVTAGLCAALGCSRGGGETAAQTRARLENERLERQRVAAREQIVAAECDRAETCGDVGPQREYASRHECEVRMRGDTEERYSPQECTGRINQAQVQACVTAVQEHGCGFRPFGWINEVGACRSSAVCSLVRREVTTR